MFLRGRSHSTRGPLCLRLTTVVTYIESHNSAGDGELLARLRVAVAHAARAILADAQAGAGALGWARAALVDPSAQVPRLIWGVVTHADFISEDGDVSDADLRDLVTALVPVLVEVA